MFASRMFRKLLLVCGGLNVLAFLVLGTLAVRWQRQQLEQQFQSDLLQSTRLAGTILAPLMEQGDPAEIQEPIRELSSRSNLQLAVSGLDGKVRADSGQEHLADDMRDELDRSQRVAASRRGASFVRRQQGDATRAIWTARVDRNGTPVGYVQCAATTEDLDARVGALQRQTWVVVTLMALALLPVVYGLAAHFAGPTMALERAAAALATGDFSQRVYVANHDELGALARSLNRMAAELETQIMALRRTSQTQATVLGGMIEGVIAVDRGERVTFANDAAGRLFQFVPRTVEGRRLLEIVRIHPLHDAVSKAFESLQPQFLEVDWETDSRLTFAVHATPLPGNPCPGAVLVLHDVMDLRRLESLRQDFVANVSHELKTPLTSIRAYAETLKSGALSDPQASYHFVERIEEQSERLQSLILNMLSLARMESEQHSLEIVVVSVFEVVESCVKQHRAAADAQHITIEIGAESDGGRDELQVRADQEALREILDNLIGNAINYTPEYGQIHVTWCALNGFVRIQVRDSGNGIPAEHLGRVFERFYRVDKARSRELGGTGLGLAIVKHLALSLGGMVGVESVVAEGSTFWVDLPVAR